MCVYEACDSEGHCTTAKISLEVTPPTAPNALDDEATIPQDSGMAVYNVLENDIEASGGVSLVVGEIKFNATHGECAVQGDIAISYTPNAGYHGQDNCVYTACNESGDCDTAVLEITIVEPDIIEEASNDFEEGAIASSKAQIEEGEDDSDNEPMDTSNIAMGVGASVIALAGILAFTRNKGAFTRNGGESLASSGKFDGSKQRWQPAADSTVSTNASLKNERQYDRLASDGIPPETPSPLSVFTEKSSRSVQFGDSNNLAFLCGDEAPSEGSAYKSILFRDRLKVPDVVDL